MGISQGHRGNEFPGSQLWGRSTQVSSRQQLWQNSPLVPRIQGDNTTGEVPPHSTARLSAGTRPNVTARFLISNPNSCKLCKSRWARAPG